MVHGFRLAGVEGYVDAPGPVARERFDVLVGEKDLAVLLLSQAVHGAMVEHVEEHRRRAASPVIMVLPDRGEDEAETNAAALMERFLGLKV